MSTPLGGTVTRLLSAVDRNYKDVIFQAGKPVLDSELNFIGQVQNEFTASSLRSRFPSGILDFKAAGQNQIIVPTLDPSFSGLQSNEFLMQNFTALVNGWVIPVNGSAVNGGQYTDLDWIAIELPPPPTSLSEQNLVFLEVWLARIDPFSTTNKPTTDTVYRFGNTQYRGQNLQDELIDPQGNIETTKRVQIQYKIRIIEDVDFNANPNGLEDPAIRAQGPNTSDTAFTFTRQDTTARKDPGLWVAGTGTDSDASSLGTTDGFVYAIPLLAVHRRNSTAWDISTNPNGSAVSLLSQPGISDRPDTLYFDEVAKRDVMDLRMEVANTDFKQILEENFSRLISGKNQNQFGRDLTNISFGSKLLEADGITGPTANPPIPPGVFFFGVADNSRRSFNDGGEDEVHFGCLDLADAAANGNFTTSANCGASGSLVSSITVSYQGGVSPGAKVTISVNPLTVPRGTVIANVIPTMTWDTVNAPVVTLTNIAEANNNGWVGLGTETAYAYLDESDPNFTALATTGTIDTLFTIQIGKGGGFRFVPDPLLFVQNNSTGKTFGFIETSDTSRTVTPFERSGLTEFPVVAGYTDTLTDFNQLSFTTPRAGYTRIYTGHFQGNGTNTYNTKTSFPPGLFNAAGDTILLYGVTGQKVLGFIKFELLDNAGNFNVIPVQAINVGADGNFVIEFTQVFSSANVIRYSAVLETQSVVYTKASKGVVDSAEVVTLDGTVVTSATATFTAPNNELILNALAFDPDGTGVNINYVVYVDNVASEPAATGGFGGSFTIGSITGFNTNSVTVTLSQGSFFNGAIARDVKLTVTHTCAPKTSDVIVFYYDHDVYQGNNQSINNAVLRSVGDQMLLHTLGTGQDDANLRPKYLSSISTRLPMGADVDDSDLDSSTEIEVVAAVPTTLYKTGNKNLDFTKTDGSAPAEGQRIIQRDFSDILANANAPLPSVPFRGVEPYLYTVTDSDLVVADDNILALITPPVINNLISVQGVWYSLVEHPRTGELLMVVATGLQKNIGISGTGNLPADTQSEQFVATQDQTLFSFSFTFPAGGQLFVFKNGVKQLLNRAYREVNNSTIEFIDPAQIPDAGDIIEGILPKGQVAVDRQTSFVVGTDYSLENDRDEQYLAYDVFRCAGRPTVKPTKKYDEESTGGTDFTSPAGGIAQTPNFSPDVVA